MSARDASGREVFRADEVRATAPVADLLTGVITLQRAQVASPRLVVSAAPMLKLIALVARRRGRRRSPSTDSSSPAVRWCSRTEPPRSLVIRDLAVRADRMAAFGGDGAFAVEMALYGANVRLTGQRALGAPGYAVHVRARARRGGRLRDFPLLTADTA